MQGFLKGAGLASLDQAEKRDTGKGEFWFAVVTKKGGPTADALPGVIDAAMTCTEQGVPRTMTMKGTYSADAYAMRVSSATPKTAGHPRSGMTMAVTVQAKRTGA